MSITRTLGKNTLGDNDKMKVAMRDYDMSTHDISTIFRSTMGVGMLVPFCKILCQKGDIIDLDLINKTLSQPTLGPLFGSFKLQHFLFFGGFRLYNSWLHNNRTGIGMKMSDIKLPMMIANTTGTAAEAHTNISASALYKYLGWSKSRRTGSESTGGVFKNGVPLLLYLDIFKNYFANTQENKFYMISNVGSEPTIKAGFGGTPSTDYKLPKTGLNVKPNKTDVVRITKPSSVADYTKAWGAIKFAIKDNKTGNGTQITADKLTTNATRETITLDKFEELYPSGGIIVSILLDSTEPFGAFLKQYNLEILDQIRDVILHNKGNETLKLIEQNLKENAGGSVELGAFIKDLKDSQSSKLGGMLLKTYDSDIFNNWIKKEWIEGAGSITDRTTIDVSEGQLTMDMLNLQQKVYNMLNRIAVSGGTYKDWLETVYTAGKYLERPETPVFIGGMTQYIEFDEVISKSATETAYGTQPLGDIAAIGRGGKPMNNGHVHYQCEEPGYIIGLAAITPIIDYSQGNDFDLNLQTIDDLHKPALDGIGYQDLIQEQMAGETSVYNGGSGINNLVHLSANKTLAWIDYMTNYNRTYGDFAAGEALDFMVLNRRYEVNNLNQIGDLTTYIDPQKYIEIFADTDLTSQNFWVQTVVRATRRGNYSAKQIPFL